jgi:hypothetical protein
MHLREVWNQPYAPLENATGLFRYGKRELKRGFLASRLWRRTGCFSVLRRGVGCGAYCFRRWLSWDGQRRLLVYV